jgi:tRNA A37 threonylcarbamoyladenosine synthetase subunit TsaC/SUA5/YrdC
MGKAQKIERFRFSETPLLASLGRITAELYQTRFLGMEVQRELRQSITKVTPEPLRLITMLKDNHDVIGETNDDNIASRIPTTPLVRPKVENVV